MYKNVNKSVIKSTKNIITSSNKSNKIPVLVSGLGPVGGFFIIYLLAKYPNTYDITAYDPKMGEYSRRTIVILQPDVLDVILHNFPKEVVTRILNASCYVHNPSKDPDAKCYQSPTKDGFLSIRTKDLEYIFYDWITKHTNVKLIKSSLPDIGGSNSGSGPKHDRDSDSQGPFKLDKYTFIVSSSGGRDNLGDKIGNTYVREPLSNGMVITFVPLNAEGKTIRPEEEMAQDEGNKENNKNIRTSRRIYKHETSKYSQRISQMLPQHRYRGFKSRDKNFYLGVQLGDMELADLWSFIEEHGEISAYNMPENVEKILKNAMKKYEIYDIDPDTLRVGFFPIIKYTATTPAGLFGTTSGIFLMGDSLYTTHFFSGMGVNAGFKMSTTLVDLMNPGKFDMPTIVKDYTEVAKDLKTVLDEASNKVTVHIDDIYPICDEYSRAEIYDMAWENELVPEGMSKREICLSLSSTFKKK